MKDDRHQDYRAPGDLRGKTFVTSGLGGMSGAQPKALEISGGAGIVAEVDPSRVETRHSQGWVSKTTDDLETSVRWMLDAARAGIGGQTHDLRTRARRPLRRREPAAIGPAL